MLFDDRSQKLLVRESLGNKRTLSISSCKIDFASNDYLGIARNGFVQNQIFHAWKSCPPPYLGSTGSRLLTGNSKFAEELENMIAEFHDAEAGLLFNSGYIANMGLVSTLMTAEDVCLYDADIHASMHDGMRLCRVKAVPWRHNDLNHLEKHLKEKRHQKSRFVLVESIYSCDGSQAPLVEICALCERYQSLLIVDEAHATGVFGPLGKGLMVELNCQHRAYARIHTFSKALGCFGAIVLGSQQLKDYLINFCRPLIYTTSLPLPILLGIREAYRYSAQADRERAHLKQLIHHFREKSKEANLPFKQSDTPTQILCIPGNVQVQAVAERLQQEGFDVRALKSPTVRRGKECLRLCLHAFNSTEEIDWLLTKIPQ